MLLGHYNPREQDFIFAPRFQLLATGDQPTGFEPATAGGDPGQDLALHRHRLLPLPRSQALPQHLRDGPDLHGGIIILITLTNLR